MKIQEFKTLLKEYIGKEKLNEVINTLETHLKKETHLFDQFVLAKNRLSRSKFPSEKNIINFEQKELIENKLRTDLLSIINTIDINDIDEKKNIVSIETLFEENERLQKQISQLEEKIAQKEKHSTSINEFSLNGTSERAREFDKELNALLKFIYRVLTPVKDEENFLFAVFTGLVKD